MNINTSIGLSEIFAFLAFAVSLYAALKTSNFNERQKSLIDSQERLNNRLYAKEQEEIDTGKKADLDGSFYTIARNSSRVKIFNKGKSQARNVRLELESNNELLNDHDVNSKFPLEILESQRSVELIAMTHLGGKNKHTIKIFWEDDFKSNNEKVIYITS